MARYYYDKYNVNQQYVEQADWILDNSISTSGVRFYSSYSFNPAINRFSVYGSEVGWPNPGSYSTGYFTINGGMTVVRVYGGYASTNLYRKDSSKSTINYTRGSLVESNVIAEDGIYPDNGRHSDGFWYVKKGLAFPSLKLKIEDTLKTSENGWVRVNGELRQIVKIYVRVDGSIKEVV